MRSAPGTIAIKLLIVLLVVVVSVLTFLFAMNSRSVIYRHSWPGSPSKEPAFTIFNPFRDRRPEKRATEFLVRLKNGDCENAMRELSQSYSAEYQQRTCERERTLRLLSWKLKNRTDENNKVRLYYEVNRQEYKDNRGQVWVTLEKAGEDWHVTRYDSAY